MTFQINTSCAFGMFFVLLSLLLVTNADSQSSSFAMNSGGGGEVTVSCNGKIYTGKDVVACTSSATYSVPELRTVMMIAVGGWLFRRFIVYTNEAAATVK